MEHGTILLLSGENRLELNLRQHFNSSVSGLVEGCDDGESQSSKTDEEEPTLLALKPSQKYVRTLLEKACRAVQARTDQMPHSLLLGALFLRAVLHLPKAIDQFPIQLSWKVDYGGSWGMKTISIGRDGILLDTLEGFDSGTGWDHESTVDWSVDETCQTGLDEWVLKEVLASFANNVSDPDASAYFSTDYDHELDHIANDPEPLVWHSAFTEQDE